MNTSLHYCEDTSDKEYHAAIEPAGDGYLVTFAYGRPNSGEPHLIFKFDESASFLCAGRNGTRRSQSTSPYTPTSPPTTASSSISNSNPPPQISQIRPIPLTPDPATHPRRPAPAVQRGLFLAAHRQQIRPTVAPPPSL